jgi:hypothetical protein
VNDGSAQRSRVSSLTVTFSRSVRLDPGAVGIVGREGAGAGVTVNVSPSSGTAATSFVLTFGGAGADGSLPDGVYDLTVSADKVHDASVAAMTLAADYTTSFHRLLADANGDARVGPEDFNLLATHFGLSGQTAATGDFNGDGTVGPEDFNLLASRFGTSLVQSPGFSGTGVLRATSSDSTTPVDPQPVRKRAAARPRQALLL